MSASLMMDTDFGDLPVCECCGAPVYRDGVMCGVCMEIRWDEVAGPDWFDGITWSYRGGELVAASCGGGQ